ncbi:FxLD family lanthipeptide [Pseudofrankia sp. DC12]|nr:FxLD family lanthipeptide [Pseudofrankia sp. DC12]
MDNPEYELDLTLVDAGPVASGHALTTDDECGSGETGTNACTTNADAS